MEPARWRLINDLFQQAIDCDVATRARFLDGACAGDVALRIDVERLVRAHERAGTFLERPAVTDALTALSSGAPLTAAADRSRALDGCFTGTERFTVIRQLGSGGMGIVYAVRDDVRQEVVALKTLRRRHAGDLYRFKREFRSLADIAHANLVCLYELVVEPRQCFFTMELVDGVGLADHLRLSSATPTQSPVATFDAARARDVLRQLVNGLAALHAKGKLHRDVKPSNILVRTGGQAVLLDFGLVTDSLTAGVDRMAGTPQYLAPELFDGAAASEASDWYGVGLTLYESMTGSLLFQGPWDQLRRQKARGDPIQPAAISPGLPEDLNAICLGLLRRDPGDRLSGNEVLAMLADREHRAADKRLRPRRPVAPRFVGRAGPLAVLAASFAGVEEGRSGAVSILGPSGIGKTALVQHFIGRLHPEVIVLRGRCYQHETVPYEALDGIVDSLTAYLRELPPTEAASLVSDTAATLALVFPVTKQVAAIAAAPRPARALKPSALRQMAFATLRDVLTRLARRRHLVLHIDDLHWADSDSLLLLDVLVRPPNPPPLLLLTCLRTEELAAKPFLREWARDNPSEQRTAVRLQPFSDDEAQDAIASFLPASVRLSASARSSIAIEAAGSPFLLEQLALHTTTLEGDTPHGARLSDLLCHRLTQAPHGARQFLEVLALCGRPMSPRVVQEAAGLAGDERRLVAALRSDQLLRGSGSAGSIETYHDRLRETIAGGLSADAKQLIHVRLLRSLRAHGLDNPETLFEHHVGAAECAGAAEQAALAAARAHAVLAFDRAAFFYRRAIELLPESALASAWAYGLAEALTNAGRPREAAQVYLDAAGGTDGVRRLDLHRRAAEQFLIGGDIDRGMDVIRTVLFTLRLPLARTPLVALAALSWRRARTRWRGLDFDRRDPNDIPDDRLLRIDTCWSVTTGLAMVDPIRAAEFNTRHVLLALEAGEPYRVARALAIEAVFCAGRGRRDAHAACMAQAVHVARELGHPQLEALSALAAGAAAIFVGEWKPASDHCARALSILHEHCSGATWETNSAQNFLLAALLFRGAVRDVSTRLPPLLDAARERGNWAFDTELRTRMNLVWLAADTPDAGEHQANEAIAEWSQKGFHRQHYNHVLALIQIALYRGDGERAWSLITSHWRIVARTLLLRLDFIRVEACYLRARAALLRASQGGALTRVGDRQRLLAVARGDGHAIGRVGTPWARSLAILLEAAVAHQDGRDDAARDRLAAAVTAFEVADMALYAAVARRRLGQLLGGSEGETLLNTADQWMRREDIVDPIRMSRLIAPGFPDA